MITGVAIIERLEHRWLSSADVVGGILRIERAEADDDVVVRVYATEARLVVVEDGKKTKFARGGVWGIFVGTGRGDDQIDLREAVLGASVRSGGGRDTVYGGRGDDTIDGGGGHDRLEGRAGADEMDGGSGEDTIWGGRGDDSLFARDGERDVVDGGKGYDFSARDGGRDAERKTEARERRRT